MAEAHGGLGELLVALYLVIAILSFVLAKRNGLPAWLTGTAHALLGVQLIMGIILYAKHPHIMPVSHVIAALLTIPAHWADGTAAQDVWVAPRPWASARRSSPCLRPSPW